MDKLKTIDCEHVRFLVIDMMTVDLKASMNGYSVHNLKEIHPYGTHNR